jgi:hypothetical protein
VGRLGDIWRRLRKQPGTKPSGAAPALPATFEVPRRGAVEAVTVSTMEELRRLRSELELLHLFAYGDSADALRILEKSADNGDAQTIDLRDSLRDARDPATASARAAIDAQFPTLAGELCSEVLADEARAFRASVLAALRQSTLTGHLEVATSYSLGADLHSKTPADPAVPASENSMTKPNDPQKPQPSTPAADASNAPGLEAALDAMAGELKNLTDIVEKEGAPDQAIVDMLTQDPSEGSVPTAEVMEESATLEDVEAAVDELMIDQPSTDAALPEDAAPELQAEAEMEAEPEPAAEESPLAEFAALDDAEPEAVEAPAEEVTFEAPEEEAVPEPVVVDAVAPVAEQEAPIVDEVMPEPEAPPPPRVAPRPAPSTPVRESFDTEPVMENVNPEPAPRESRPEPSPARSAPRRPRERRPAPTWRRPRAAGDVENAISNLADFLQGEVAALWEEARAALEQTLADQDEVAEFHAKAAELHDDMQRIRNEVAAARRESRMLSAQLHSLRDEAARAKQRADAAAHDAQSAADRAAAAAREAEITARFDQK